MSAVPLLQFLPATQERIHLSSSTRGGWLLRRRGGLPESGFCAPSFHRASMCVLLLGTLQPPPSQRSFWAVLRCSLLPGSVSAWGFSGFQDLEVPCRMGIPSLGGDGSVFRHLPTTGSSLSALLRSAGLGVVLGGWDSCHWRRCSQVPDLCFLGSGSLARCWRVVGVLPTT